MPVCDRVREALDTRDGAALAALLADDVILHTPVALTQRYQGAAFVGHTLTLALATLESLHVTDSLHGLSDQTNQTHALIFTAQVGAHPLQGVMYVTANGDERLSSVTLLLRPFRALEAFVAQMAARGAQPARDFLQGAL